MSAMPWFKVASDAARDEKVRRLRVRVGDTADAYVLRLWCYCAETRADGRFDGKDGAGLLEHVVEWRGDRGALVDAMVDVGLVDKEGEALAVHNWGERQEAIVVRFEKDKKRPDGRKIPRGIPPNSRAGESEKQAVFDIPPAREPLPSQVVSSFVSKGGAGENAERPSGAESRPLVERLDEVFREATGGDLPLPQREQEAVRKLLSLAKGNDDEIVLRFRRGLARTRYPTCNSLQELAEVRCWNACAREPDGQAPPMPKSTDRPPLDEFGRCAVPKCDAPAERSLGATPLCYPHMARAMADGLSWQGGPAMASWLDSQSEARQ